MLTTTDVAETYLNGLGMSAKRTVWTLCCACPLNVLMHSVNLNAVSHGRGSQIVTPPQFSWFPITTIGRALEAKAHYYGPRHVAIQGHVLFEQFFPCAQPVRRRLRWCRNMPFTQALVSALGGGGVAPGGPVGEADRDPFDDDL